MAYIGNTLRTAQPNYQIIDDISASFNGSTTSFALQVGGVTPAPFPVSAQHCLISVGGVIQQPDPTGTDGFLLSGSNIVFSAAPSAGEDFFGVVLAGADYINVGAAFPDGSVATPSITFDQDTDTGLYRRGANNIAITTNGTERVSIDSGGRLLVGTSSVPVSSTAVLQGRSGATTGEAILRLCRGQETPADAATLGDLSFGDSNNGDAARIFAQRDGGTWTSGSSRPTRLVFSTAADGASSPTERMRITNQGALWGAANTSILNFGTGTHYHGFTQNSGGQWVMGLNNKAVGGDSFGLVIFYDNTPNSTGNAFVLCRDASANRVEIRSNGGIANFQSNNVNLCDEREKKNIEALDSTWDCLKNWDLKKFHYNEDADTEDKKYGVIAQQVALHCPEVITTWLKQEAKDAVLDDDGNVVTPAKEEITRMGVKEQQMMWMAINALQEAQTRIETLEAEKTAQQTQLDDLIARVTALETN